MKKLNLFTVFFISSCISVAAFANTGDNQQNDLNNRIELLERTVNSVQKSLLNAISGGKFSSENNKDISKHFTELSEEIKLLRSDVENLEMKIKKYSSQLDNFETSVKNRFDQISKNANRESNNINHKDSYIISNISKEIEMDINYNDIEKDKKTVDVNASAEYQKAYMLLKQKNSEGKIQYEKAMEAFEKFIKKFPQSPLIGNAYYWVGAIYAQQKHYSKAAIEFLNGYKATPKSGRAIDNLLGLADALFKLGKNKETCSALNKLYDEFPNLNTTNKREADDLYKNSSCMNE